MQRRMDGAVLPANLRAMPLWQRQLTLTLALQLLCHLLLHTVICLPVSVSISQPRPQLHLHVRGCWLVARSGMRILQLM